MVIGSRIPAAGDTDTGGFDALAIASGGGSAKGHTRGKQKRARSYWAHFAHIFSQIPKKQRERYCPW